MFAQTLSCSVAIVLLFIFFSTCCYAQCKSGDILVAEDDQYYYCAEPHNYVRIQSAIRAIDVAAMTPGCAGGDYCNFFVATIGETLNIPYFRDIFFPQKKQNIIGGPDEVRRANDIYAFIERAIASSASGWKSLSPSAAQAAANQGRFVIGVARNIDLTHSGHIAIVAPAWIPKRSSSNPAAGPFVRDSQSPHLSVQAGVHRFVSPQLSSPIWAVWEGY